MTEAPWPVARYELLAKAYIPKAPGREHELLEAGAEVLWGGKPGPHMKPLDADGEEAVRRAGKQVLDPFGTIHLNSISAEDEITADRIGAAVARAMGAAGGDAEVRIAALEAKLAALMALPPPPPPAAPPPPAGVLPPPPKK